MTKFLTRIALLIAMVVGVIEASSPTNDSLSRVVSASDSSREEPKLREEPKGMEPKLRVVIWDQDTTLEEIRKEARNSDDSPISLIVNGFSFFDRLKDKSDGEKEELFSPIFEKVVKLKCTSNPPRGDVWSPSRTQRSLNPIDPLQP